MMHKFMQAVAVLVVLLVLLSVAGAQDVVPTPNPSPLNGEGGAISNAADWITLIAGIGLGMIAGGGSVLVVVSRMRHDVVLLTAMERLAASWPVETRALLTNLAFVMGEVTDNVPAAEKKMVVAESVGDLPIHG